MKVVRMDFPDFKGTETTLKDIFKKLPKAAGNTALNLFKDSWRRGGFIDRRLERWPKRKPQAGRNSRALLVKSGALRRSLRMRAGTDYFEIYSESKYAKAHNEGATITQKVTDRQRRYFWAMYYKELKYKGASQASVWKGMALSDTLVIKIPKRQFMGESWLLEQRIVKHLELALEHALSH